MESSGSESPAICADVPDVHPGNDGESSEEMRRVGYKSDFDSSDLDEVLMSMGTQQEGMAHTAKVWGQRAHKKRKRQRDKANSQAPGSVPSDGNDGEPAAKRPSSSLRCRAVGGLPAQLRDDVRVLLVRGQALYTQGEFEQAIESMHTVIRMEPGL